MFLGLPANYANGTIRLGVIMQTLAASATFARKKVLPLKKGIILSIPTTIGSILGAFIAISINKDVFEIIVGIVMVFMLVTMILNPNRWIEGKEKEAREKTNWLQLLIFFAIGIYGGFIHIGVGIFMLAALVMVSGFNLVQANALKVFIVLIYSPFALGMFMLSGQLSYGMGLIAAIGNIAGGIVASHFAVEWGAKVLRWILMAVVILFSLKLFGIIQI